MTADPADEAVCEHKINGDKMLEVWMLWAAVETESSAYKGGQIAGKILITVLAVAVVWAIGRRIRDR